MKMADFLRLIKFTSLILHCGHDNLNSFSRILLKFVLCFVNNKFSDKFNNGGGLVSSVLLFLVLSYANSLLMLDIYTFLKG